MLRRGTRAPLAAMAAPIRVETFDSLARSHFRPGKSRAASIIRGLRARFAISNTNSRCGHNQRLDPEIETVFLMATRGIRRSVSSGEGNRRLAEISRRLPALASLRLSKSASEKDASAPSVIPL